MKKQTIILLLGLFFSTYSHISNASVCASLIKNIQRDITQSGSAIQTIRLPWMDIYWLKKRLGKPAESSSSGDKLQYTWYCPESEEFHLTAVANKNGLVAEINGQYSSEAGAEFFSVELPQNAITTPEPKPATPKAPEITTPPEPTEPPKPVLQQPEPEVKNTEKNAADELLDPYNTYFQSSIKSKDELIADMTHKLQSFYQNIRSCTPGIYRYAIYLHSGFIFPVSTIDGKQKGLCQVNTIFTVPNLGEINAQCLYTPKNLTVYTDEEAEGLIKGKTFDKNKPSSRDKVEAESCETYINGKLQPKLVK